MTETSLVTDQPSSLQAPPEPKAQRVRKMFDGIAPTYDLLNECISLGMHRRWKRLAADKLQLKSGSEVLDLCTGTGDLVEYLLPLVGTNGVVHGVDFSSAMLEVAQKRFRGSRNAQFQLGDALDLPYEDNRLDAAIVGFGLRNVTDIQRAVNEMARVVKPGGWVVSLDTSPEPKLPGYWLYFSVVMPLIGRFISKDRDAYDYLFRSTRQFKSPDALAQVFHTAGLDPVSIQMLSFGTVAIIAGQKL